jgi:hypothetical protein
MLTFLNINKKAKEAYFEGFYKNVLFKGANVENYGFCNDGQCEFYGKIY